MDDNRGVERERAILEEVIELDPVRLTFPELVLRMATHLEATEEVDQIRQAVRELRRSGLVRYRSDDEVIEPTIAAVIAYRLFTT